MYLIDCLLLFFLVYLSPALALFPNLIISARTAIAIPFVSAFIIVLLKIFLASFDMFSHDVVLIFSIVFFIAATYRVFNISKKSQFDWSEQHISIYVFNFLIIIYYFAKLGTNSFASNDEIYSWNMWAVQHYLGEVIDYYYTKSPYPQFFPILISYCYKILGSIELQLPVKSLLAIFPFCLLTTIGIAPKESNSKNISLYYLLMTLLVFGIGIGKKFDDGLPDPLMASALIVSVFLFIQYLENTGRIFLLWMSAICGIVALYSKQPALLWAIISFPLIAINSILRNKQSKIILLPAIIMMLFGLLWISGEGSGFQNNPGVIGTSLHGRNIGQQLLFAANRYFIQNPLILLLLLSSYISVARSKKYVDIFYLLVIPSLLMWFIFGAYSLRLGIHVVSLAALLLAASNYNLPFLGFHKILENIGLFFQKKKKYFFSVVFFVSVIVSVLSINKSMRKIGNGFDLYKGGRNTISKFFGEDAEFIYNNIYDRSDILLWIPSNYIYGIFYGHNNVMRPDYDNVQKYSIETLISEIEKNYPDYLFYSGPRVAYGPGSDLLYELAENQCPSLFEKIAGPQNKYGYIVYKLRKDKMTEHINENQFNMLMRKQ